MNFRKLVAAAAAFALALSVTACTQNPASAPASTPASKPASTPASAPAAEGLKIAIVTSPNSVDDGSFNENNYDGVLKFIETHPDATVTPVQETTGDVAAAVEKVGEIVADYDVIVCAGFQFGGIGDLAKANPDKKFVLVDAYPSKDGTDEVVENIYAMQFAEQESGFFAGIAAALETKSNKVAVVNGVAYPSNVNYQYGFECGVKYVNETMNKKVEIIETGSHNGKDVTGADVGGNYTGDFGDQAAGKQLGETLIGKGVDVLFVAAGDSGNGVITAAKEAKTDVKIIGCDVDQYDDGKSGDKNVILTSALKVMDINVERALNAIVDGTFKGGNNLLKADTDSTGFVSEDGRHQMSADTVKAVQDAYEKVKSGEIIPASNFGGFTPDEFKTAK